MRILIVSSFVLSLVSAAAAQDDARALLEKAIIAHGGERLAKARTQIRAVKGEIVSFPEAVPFTGEAQLKLPDKGRWAFELDQKGQKLPVILVLNGDKGWRTGGGATKEMSDQEISDLREEVYINWLITLLPILEKKLTIAAVPDTKVNGEPAAGIKVANKGRPEVKLYFDKKSGLLVKAEHKGKEAGVDVNKEYIFSNHREVDGVKLPLKCVVMSNGKRAAEWTATEYKLPERIDDAAFGKP
jgi:hypothetical protein